MLKVVGNDSRLNESEIYKKFISVLQESEGYICITKHEDEYKVHVQGLNDDEIYFQLELLKHWLLKAYTS